MEGGGVKGPKPAGRRLNYIPHALERMKQRGISRSEVEQALSKRIGAEPSDVPDRIAVTGVTDTGRKLKIILERADTELTVITVYPAR